MKNETAEILIVDDEEKIRKLLLKILKNTPHNLDQAEDGLAALSASMKKNYDLMIVDLKMPNMDGQRLIEEVRKSNKLVALIVLTGHGDLGKAYELLEEYRISDFLTKPLQAPSQLLFSVQNALEKQRLYKEILDSNKKLEAANKDIKNFANLMSHDLRSPLVNLQGFSHELKVSYRDLKEIIDEASPSFTDKQRERFDELFNEDIPDSLGYINSATSTMDRLVTSMLTLSRVGKRELKFEEIETNKLLKEKISSLHHEIKSKGIEVNLNELPNVIADRTALDQIFTNILSNAIKYINPNRPGEIEILGERSGKETLFSVKDNGRGIAKEDFHKVFELFRRAGKPVSPGEGIGMPYTKILVERHGGEMCFESKEGKGTTFHFSIQDGLSL